MREEQSLGRVALLVPTERAGQKSGPPIIYVVRISLLFFPSFFSFFFFKRGIISNRTYGTHKIMSYIFTFLVFVKICWSNLLCPPAIDSIFVRRGGLTV